MRALVYEALMQGGKQLDFRGIHRLGAGLAWVCWHVLPGRRRLACRNVAARLDLEPGAAKRLARASFISNFQSFLEILLSPRVDWRFIRDRLLVETPDLVAAFIHEPRPVVLATAHLGAWELLAGILHLYVRREHRCIVARRYRDSAMNSLLLRLRGRPGIQILEHRQSASTVSRVLKANGACAFLVDHNCRRDEAIFLPFLGKVAAVNMGPALLAIRNRALVWPCFMLRQPDARYRLRLSQPLDPSALSGTFREKMAAVAEFYSSAIEAEVRACPEQWFWMHNRWKTQPVE